MITPRTTTRVRPYTDANYTWITPGCEMHIYARGNPLPIRVASVFRITGTRMVVEGKQYYLNNGNAVRLDNPMRVEPTPACIARAKEAT